MASYSLKMIDKVTKDHGLLYGNMDYTPIAIPLGHITPSTLNDQIERILLGSGAITREAYDMMKGIRYDADVENGKEDFDNWESDSEHFEISSFAQYEDLFKALNANDNESHSQPPLITPETPTIPVMGETPAVSQTSDSAIGSASEVSNQNVIPDSPQSGRAQ